MMTRKTCSNQREGGGNNNKHEKTINFIIKKLKQKVIFDSYVNSSNVNANKIKC